MVLNVACDVLSCITAFPLVGIVQFLFIYRINNSVNGARFLRDGSQKRGGETNGTCSTPPAAGIPASPGAIHPAPRVSTSVAMPFRSMSRIQKYRAKSPPFVAVLECNFSQLPGSEHVEFFVRQQLSYPANGRQLPGSGLATLIPCTDISQ